MAPKIGKTEDWIIQTTGVRERRISDEDMSEMGARAGAKALEGGGPPDLILNASGVQRQVLPDSSVFIQRELGLTGIPCHSVHATCLSFIVALHTAYAFVHCGAYRRILIVSADQGSRGRNFDEPESAALLGDGAAAAIVEASPEGSESGMLSYHMGTWSEGAELTEVRGGGSFRHPEDPRTTHKDNFFSMNGPGVYKMARRRMAIVLKRMMNQADVGREQLDLIIPHQASGPAVQAAARYGMPMEKVMNIIGYTGNCVASSLPMALAIADGDGRLQRGDHLLMVGTGAGLSVAGFILKW